MIELNRIQQSLGGRRVLDHASAAFAKGQVTAIIGPNGAGKSTLLSIASRLSQADGGSVCINQTLLNEWRSCDLAKTLAVLPQKPQATMQLTVRDLVAFGRYPHSKGRLNDRDQVKIDEAIAHLGLQDLSQRYLQELSGGQQQMAFIAMVLAQDTDYIFFDEPLASLDIHHALHIMKQLRKLSHQQNKSVVVVIHDINFAASYADQVIALKQGRIAASGPVEQVMQADILQTIYDTPFEIQTINGQRLCLYYHG